MKRDTKGNLKRVMAVMMLACLLFTMGKVNSKTDYNYGVMPCGEAAEKENADVAPRAHTRVCGALCYLNIDFGGLKIVF